MATYASGGVPRDRAGARPLARGYQFLSLSGAMMRGNRGDDTHHKKRPVHDIGVQTFNSQGRTPITKNIRVVDDAGNLLQSTYPKRALGLVKHGRARFIDNKTIELMRPPEAQAEETTMHTQAQDHTMSATAPFGGNSERPQAASSRELIASDILQRIDMLIGETAYLRESVDALGRIESAGAGDPHSPGDIGTQAKAMAIASVVEQRELTNQKLIALLDRMYADLSPATVERRPSRSPEEMKLIERLIDQSPEMSEDTLNAFLDKLT